MNSPTVIQRGIMTYYLYNEKVVVGIGDKQFVSYNQYENSNRQGITQFRKTILHSKEGEYDTPSDQMSLAAKCDIRGSGTTKPKEIQ